MGCHTEPAAVHIAHVLQRLHFFQFFHFFLYFTRLTAKKKLHALTAKKDNSTFFIIYTTYRKKKLHAFTAKKNYTTRRFFRTPITFFMWQIWPGLAQRYAAGAYCPLHWVSSGDATPTGACRKSSGSGRAWMGLPPLAQHFRARSSPPQQLCFGRSVSPCFVVRPGGCRQISGVRRWIVRCIHFCVLFGAQVKSVWA